jgi:adenine deaminase
MKLQSMMAHAERIRHGSIHKAIREIRPEVCRKRQASVLFETGETGIEIVSRTMTETIMESSMQSGLCPATVRRYRARLSLLTAKNSREDEAKNNDNADGNAG